MAESLNLAVLLCDGDYGINAEAISPSGDIAVIDLHAGGVTNESVIDEIKARRGALNRSLRSSIGSSIRNVIICLTDRLSRVCELAALYDEIGARWDQTTMDIIVWAEGKAGRETAEDVLKLKKFNLRVYYIRDDELTAADILGVCADIIENRQKGARMSDGFYFLRGTVGSMGDFPLFYELSARRLEDLGKAGSLGVTAEDARSYTKRFVADRFKKLGPPAFRYLLWVNNASTESRWLDFNNGPFDAASEYRENGPFHENVMEFIRINCSAAFLEYMKEAGENEGSLYDMFFSRLAPAFGDAVGEARITMMLEALELLKATAAAAEKERAAFTVDTGVKPDDGCREDLWAYSSYMFKQYFEPKMEHERLTREIELAESIIAEIDKAVAKEKENLEEFYVMLNKNRDLGNAFAQKMYDAISGLFKANKKAEDFLLKNIKSYISELKPSIDDSSISRALFAKTAAKFNEVLSSRVSTGFDFDTGIGVKSRFTDVAESFLPPPQLLIEGYARSFDLVGASLGIERAEHQSLKGFSGYGAPAANALCSDGNAILKYEYYLVNAEKAEIFESLVKLI